MSRILLKLSGESFADPVSNFGIQPETIERIASEITEANNKGIEIGVVVGGGNFFRGVQESAKNMAQANADYMGMLATVINAVALKDALDKNGTQTRVQSAITMTAVAEPYIRLRAIRHLEKGRVVIFAAGTGNPYFTTDTAASLRAAEIEASLMLKSTRVDGVFDKDPEKNTDAKKFDEGGRQSLRRDLAGRAARIAAARRRWPRARGKSRRSPPLRARSASRPKLSCGLPR